MKFDELILQPMKNNIRVKILEETKEESSTLLKLEKPPSQSPEQYLVCEIVAFPESLYIKYQEGDVILVMSNGVNTFKNNTFVSDNFVIGKLTK